MGWMDFLSGKKEDGVVKTKKPLTPQLDPYSEGGGYSTAPQLARAPLPPRYLKWLAFNIDILRTSILHLKNEIFINGISVETGWESKCTNSKCGKEFEYRTKKCDECGSQTSTPDWSGKRKLEKLFRSANSLGQPLIDVIREVEEDIEIYDNGMLLTQFEYLLDKETGEILGRIPKEHRSVSPVFFRKMISDYGEIGCEPDGTPARVCLFHRENKVDVFTCPICGAKTHPIEFTEIYGKRLTHFIVGEIIHKTKYTSTKKMGYSPIYAIWMKLYSLYYLDKQQMKQFQEGRPPKGFMVMNMAQSMLDGLMSKVRDMLRVNPNQIPFLAIETQARKMAEFINVSGTSSDQQILEHRDAIRRMIGALYGVMPVFTGDIQTSSGLNSEGQQMVVTNKAVKRGQDKLNEILYEVSLMYEADGWSIVVAPAEEKDELREIQLKLQKTQNANMMVGMGFSVSIGDDGEFEFSETPENPPTSQRTFGSSPDTPSFGDTPLFSESKSFEKSDKTLQEEDETLDGIYKELKETLKLENKKKITQGDLKKMRELLATKFSDISWKKLESFIHKQYMNEVELIEKRFGRNVTTLAALGAVAGLISTPENQDAMEELRQEQLIKFDEIVQKSSEEGYFDPLKFKKMLKELTDYSEARINNIVRTTSNKISNSARLNAYKEFDEKGEARYKLVTVHDNRRCQWCANVEKRVGKRGLPLNELLDIMEEESNAGYAPDWTFDRDSPTMHWQTRSVIEMV